MINPQPSSPAPTHTQITTFKVACRQGLVPGSIVRRVLLVLIIATVGGLLLRLPAYNPSPTQHRSIILAKTRYTSPSGMVSHATSNLGDREIDIASDALPVVATLRERLDVWRKAPGGKGEIEGEVEHGGFMKWNLEQCSTINEQHSSHMIQHCTNSWMSLNRTTLHDDRMGLIDFMEGVLERNDHLKGFIFDSDSIPICDPEYMFDASSYKRIQTFRQFCYR
ncbi:uncharacterized protein L203_100833 [Cryptococcus depauperatus CBS 7841]|uniref:Uncharacterized protein n=1 Tax=Cryptococcus depauperatus CBS 7841 TaxID=1295531 RepID=A0AAJ8JNW9_9TREE